MARTDPLPLPPVAPIDLELLAALPSVPLRARYLVDCFLAGRHRSPFKGSSPEFAEYGAYQAGDEIRRIDWRLYGRSDRLVVKQFEDESPLRICLALDLSASLRYRSRPELLTKFDFARTILAAVALLARRQQDTVGLAFIGDTAVATDASLFDFVRPGSSAAHHAALFKRLDAPPEARTSSIAGALERIASLMPRGSQIVLASDFYADLTGLDAALHRLGSQKIELVALQVLDPMELDFSADVTGRFVDLESDESLALNSGACRAGYLERFGRFRRELTKVFRSHEVELSLLRTDANPLTALASCLAARARLVP